MPKNKRPTPDKTVSSPEEKEDALIRRIGELALMLAEQEDGADEAAMRKRQDDAAELNKIIRKCLHRQEDDILYEALESSKDLDVAAWQLLRETMAEASEVAVIRREQEGDVEINAFVIPVFARTDGGLQAEQCFTDQEAFEQLGKSMQQAGLESPEAKVVLINHAYHLDEIDSITYSHLSDMLRDAYASMTDKKAAATPAIDRSFGGWPDNLFLPGDQAIELRFLLGFALKRVDDAFYRVPEDEAGMDAYFEQRAARFQQWTISAAPLLKRLLVDDGAAIDVNFLYQDLFHGGKERGIAEYFMLQMMSTLNQGLADCGIEPEATHALAGPVNLGDDIFLRVNLYRKSDDALVVTAEKPFGAGIGSDLDLQNEIDDVYDALGTIGVDALAIASGFDAQGHPLEVRPYSN
ncbi:DUF2863 family protein [Oxalobacteraceae bacterium CAVE-383]|nr:DUF2863 family protein [Oxalobacteraceae bacterium CAVE-383]